MTGSLQSQAIRAGAFASGVLVVVFPVSAFIYVTGRTLAVPGTNVKAISLFR